MRCADSKMFAHTERLALSIWRRGDRRRRELQFAYIYIHRSRASRQTKCVLGVVSSSCVMCVTSARTHVATICTERTNKRSIYRVAARLTHNVARCVNILCRQMPTRLCIVSISVTHITYTHTCRPINAQYPIQTDLNSTELALW